MFGQLRRAIVVATLTLLAAACQVVPDAGPQTTGPVVDQPDTPTDTALPTDADRHRIALLVPITGANAEAGQAIANATTMALLDTAAENLRITTYDTASGAGEAAARAVADGNRLILGPLLREDVAAVAARARPADVPLITFSNDAGIAAPDVFVMGQIPEQSIARTVAYAQAQGARRFAALLPEGEYGDRALAALQRAVAASGAQFAGAERYDRGNRSIISAAGRLDARGGFDTVLFADGARLATLAAAELKEAGEGLPTLIGTELWSGEATLGATAPMRGALFSSVSDARYGQFAQSYEARFGSRPYRIATLGYDAVLFTLRAARGWRPGTAFPSGQLLAEGGFVGLDGPIRFRANGLGERAMEVRQVTRSGADVVDAAPARF